MFINMFRINKTLSTCSHKWEFLDEQTERDYTYNGIEPDFFSNDVVYCYCPKCRTRQKVSPLEWKLRLKEQEIDEKYTEEIYEEFR